MREEDNFYVRGNRIGIEEGWDEFVENWRGIYQMREDNIVRTWYGGWVEGLKEVAERDQREWECGEGGQARGGGLRDANHRMERPKMDMGWMVRCVKGWGRGKAPGPDGVRGEIIKDIVNRDGCRKALLKSFNELLEGGEAPSTWKLSRTKMIKKVKKPTVKEFRPIAVTSLGYKLYWGYMREVIEEHIIKNGM